MAEKSKIVVKLRDGGSVFFDQKNQQVISGRWPVEVVATSKINDGLRGGALVKVENEELQAFYDTQKSGKKEPKKPELPVETDEEKALRIANEKRLARKGLLKQLKEDKVDLGATDYTKLVEWSAVIIEAPLEDKKKETLVSALQAAVDGFTEEAE